LYSFKLNCLSENYINLIAPVKLRYALALRLPKNDVTYPLEMEVVYCQYNQHLIMEPEAVNAGFAQCAFIWEHTDRRRGSNSHSQHTGEWTHELSAWNHGRKGWEIAERSNSAIRLSLGTQNSSI